MTSLQFPMTHITLKFLIGQRVEKRSADSFFEGEVVCAFVKRDGKTIRYIVENDDGICLICNERQLWLPDAPGPAVNRDDPK